MSAVVKAVKKVVKTVAKAVEKVVTTVVDTAKAIIKDPLPTIAAIAGQAVGIPAPVTMAAITGARGGDLEDMAKAAAIAYVAPKAASTVSQAISPTVASAVTNEAAAKAITNATSKALVNGSIAAATGGDFGEAAAGTMAGSLAASGYQNLVAPSVMAKAQDMGLSVDTAKDVSAALRTGVAVGTATAVSGGDFVSAFATAVADQGIEKGFEKTGEAFSTSAAGEALRASPIGKAAEKITETYDNVTAAIDNAFKKKDVPNTPPSGNGVPTALVNEVPVSPNANAGVVANLDGKPIGSIDPSSNDAAYNQIVAAFEAPTTPSKQLGVPSAALTSIGGEKLESISAGSGAVTDEPLFAGSGFAVGVDQTASPIRNITVDGKNYQTRDITDASGKTTYYFDPTDKAVTAKPKEYFDTTGDTDTQPKSLAPIEVTASRDALDLDDLNKLQKASTGQFTSAFVPKPSVPELQQAAEKAKTAAVQAAVTAQVTPTPENKQVAVDAQLNAELAQAALNDAVKMQTTPTPEIIAPPAGTTLTGGTATELGGVQPVFGGAVQPGEALQPSAIGGVDTTGGLSALTPGGISDSVLGGTAAGAGQIGGVPTSVPGGEVGGVSAGAPGGLPSGVVDTGLPGGVEEGIPQLPPVEVIGEPEDKFATQQFPLTPPDQLRPGQLGGVGGGGEYQRRMMMRRRSPLAALLSPNDQGLIDNLGEGVVFTGLPFDFLEPSLLARGGLIRLKKV